MHASTVRSTRGQHQQHNISTLCLLSWSLYDTLCALCLPKVFNEMNSPFYEANAKPRAKQLANMSEEDAAESNMKYSLNGYIYCNLPGLNMTVGEK